MSIKDKPIANYVEIQWPFTVYSLVDNIFKTTFPILSTEIYK